MRNLIKNGQLTQDHWTILREATGPEVLKAVPGKSFIVPLKFWKLYQDELANYAGEVAIWLDSDENVNDIGSELERFALIALNFPIFSDGRSYTNARELRDCLKYGGEIRAIGDVLRDQLCLGRLQILVPAIKQQSPNLTPCSVDDSLIWLKWNMAPNSLAFY